MPWLLLLVAPYPALAYIAAQTPVLVFPALGLYYLLPFALALAGQRLGRWLPASWRRRAGAVPPEAAAVALPFLPFWLAAPAVWPFARVYKAWLRTSGTGAPIAAIAGAWLGLHVAPLLAALLVFAAWSLAGAVWRRLAPA